MNGSLTRSMTPEEQELDRKHAELEILKIQLSEIEFELLTLRARVDEFEHHYFRIVGVPLSELDEVEAQIAAVLALLAPYDPRLAERASKARQRAQDSAQTTADKQVMDEGIAGFQPTEELKSLYRNIAKMVHPDLAIESAERIRRTRWMAEVNEAYRAGDNNRLQAIMFEWQQSPENIQGKSIGADLVRVIRQIAQVQRRIAEVKSELSGLQQTSTYILYSKVVDAEKAGEDLLGAIAREVGRQLLAKHEQLNALLEEFTRRNGRL